MQKLNKLITYEIHYIDQLQVEIFITYCLMLFFVVVVPILVLTLQKPAIGKCDHSISTNIFPVGVFTNYDLDVILE